jgi:hypothetical protein
MTTTNLGLSTWTNNTETHGTFINELAVDIAAIDSAFRKDGVQITGTTASGYVEVFGGSWACPSHHTKIITLVNTGATNALKYKITGYVGATPTIIWNETVLALGTSQQFTIETYYTSITCEVKDAASGSHTTYTVDYSGW